MTDDEIIKALECCCDTKNMLCRDDCPLADYDGVCWSAMKFEVLSLINRLMAENERLRKGIEKLADESDARDIDEYNILCQVRAEAIKQFAERIKDRKYLSSEWSHAEHPYVVEVDDIDDILEEMVGDDNAD